MKVRQDHVLNLESVLGSKRNVLVGVALRVNDSGCPRGFVSEQVGSMCQARQVELFEDQSAPSLFAGRYFG